MIEIRTRDGSTFQVFAGSFHFVEPDELAAVDDSGQAVTVCKCDVSGPAIVNRLRDGVDLDTGGHTVVTAVHWLISIGSPRIAPKGESGQLVKEGAAA